MFSCEFSEISKNTFFTEHLWRTASTYNKFKIVKLYSYSGPLVLYTLKSLRVMVNSQSTRKLQRYKKENYHRPFP